jgi:2'-5' RNA ligase
MASDDSKAVRCFVAIDIPDAVKAEIAGLQRDLRQFRARVSWARTEGIHLTLKFLGDVKLGLIPNAVHSLETAVSSLKGFTVSAEGVGCFPNSRRPRVMWVGLDGGDALRAVQETVETALEPLGFEQETRKFNPHLTLGRVKSAQGIDDVVRRMEELGFTRREFPATEIRLMQSDLQPTGAVYTVLHTFSLLPANS